MVATASPMAKKKTEPSKGKRYPSRDNTKYVGIPVKLHGQMERLADLDDRSTTYMVVKAVREFLERNQDRLR